MPDVNEHESNETPQTTPNVPPQTAQPQASWQPPETWAAQQPAQAPFQQPMPAQQPLPTPTPQPWAPQQPLPTPPLPGAQSRQQPVNGFTVAGLVLGILAIIVALWAFGDYVSVFGVVGLALGIIGWFYTKD